MLRIKTASWRNMEKMGYWITEKRKCWQQRQMDRISARPRLHRLAFIFMVPCLLDSSICSQLELHWSRIYGSQYDSERCWNCERVCMRGLKYWSCWSSKKRRSNQKNTIKNSFGTWPEAQASQQAQLSYYWCMHWKVAWSVRSWYEDSLLDLTRTNPYHQPGVSSVHTSLPTTSWLPS